MNQGAYTAAGSSRRLSRTTISGMAVQDIFSRRQKRLRGEAPDVYSYDRLSKELRVQLVHFFRDYLGDERQTARADSSRNPYRQIVGILHREYGTFRLAGQERNDEVPYMAELIEFLQAEKDVERVLDAVELACQEISQLRTGKYGYRADANAVADRAFSELNARFLEHGIGYRFEAGTIVRVDSEVVHAEVVKPALALLHDPRFKGAEAEFHQAFEHYRHGRMKEALAECLKALESTMKSIATARNWTFDAKATANRLVDLMFQKGLIPELWTNHFSGLRAMLESGVPTARNRLAGHGQGTEVVPVPPHFVAFALHQTAAAIVFLATAEKQLQ